MFKHSDGNDGTQQSECNQAEVESGEWVENYFTRCEGRWAWDHGEPPLDGHVRERVPELGAPITTHLISSTVDREYPAQVVMLT